jgi:chromosome partitioning protein
VVLDTPAQLSGRPLEKVLKIADSLVVPLQPSMFDILATRGFLDELLGEHRAKDRVAVVGMRVDPRTRSADQLGRFVAGLGLPVAATCATRRTTCSSPPTACRSSTCPSTAWRRTSRLGSP